MLTSWLKSFTLIENKKIYTRIDLLNKENKTTTSDDPEDSLVLSDTPTALFWFKYLVDKSKRLNTLVFEYIYKL